MSNFPTLAPSMTAAQIAVLLEEYKAPRVEVYVRIESIAGKPCVMLIREPHVPDVTIPAFLRRQAE